MSQRSNSEAVAALQVQPVTPSQLFQLRTKRTALRQRLLPQVNKPQQNRRDVCAAAELGDRSLSYYLACPSQVVGINTGCPEVLLMDFQPSDSPWRQWVPRAQITLHGQKNIASCLKWGSFGSALPRASVGKELFGLTEYVVSVSSEHPLLSSPKPLTNDIASN